MVGRFCFIKIVNPRISEFVNSIKITQAMPVMLSLSKHLAARAAAGVMDKRSLRLLGLSSNPDVESRYLSTDPSTSLRMTRKRAFFYYVESYLPGGEKIDKILFCGKLQGTRWNLPSI